jgi:CelD/BcsL family acetyltransferase involved in cellulose biosynthesis
MKHGAIIPSASPAIRVEIVETPDQLRQLRPAWERLQERDVESTVFLSWAWMERAFRSNPFRWSVIVARAEDDPDELAGILPLKYRVHWSRSRNELQTELEAGGRLLWSEYTGFLCDSRYEKAALEAMAAALSDMPWVRLSMRYVPQKRRARLFTDAFKGLGFSCRYKEYFINKKTTNNLLCPQVMLPEDFTTYLATGISASRRQQLSRFRRRMFDTGKYRITQATDATAETDIAIATDLWKARWREHKGKAQTEMVAGNYRDVLHAARATGVLFLPILWKDTQPLGALGHVLDPKNGIVHFIFSGRDISVDEPFVGPSLHYHSIEWAIEQGYVSYDFCHGDEPYKYSYGAENYETVYFEIRRREFEGSPVFDPLCLGQALTRVDGFLEKGDTDTARKAVKQLATLLAQ